MGSWFSLTLMLAFWLVLSVTTGVHPLEALLAGIALIFLVKTLDRGLMRREHFPQPRRWSAFLATMFHTLLVLVRDVVRANIQMARVILDPRLPISPRMVEHRSHLQTLAARVALSNCITLTPGTLTVRLQEDLLLVHALTQSAEEGLEDWELERLLGRLEEN